MNADNTDRRKTKENVKGGSGISERRLFFWAFFTPSSPPPF